MTPLELLARLAALVPPPRFPLLRYFGVFAANSPWRPFVVPRPPDASTACRHAHGDDARTDSPPPAPPSPAPADSSDPLLAVPQPVPRTLVPTVEAGWADASAESKRASDFLRSEIGYVARDSRERLFRQAELVEQLAAEGGGDDEALASARSGIEREIV